jgi:hypothetical protein
VTNRLVDEGWIAPEHAGPTRRTIIGVVACTLALLGAWSLWSAGNFHRIQGSKPARNATLRIDSNGHATTQVRGKPVGLVPGAELRTDGQTRFVVVRGPLITQYDRPVRLRFELPDEVDPATTTIRVIAPHADVRRLDRTTFLLDGSLAQARVMVVMPASDLPAVADAPRAGTLGAVTGPADRERADTTADRRSLHRLQHGWWWILPLGTLLAAGVPLWAWRRHARSFFAMRVPGAGKDMSAGPPSSLDPVGAAILAAGAGHIDAEGAFAAHVLDLVERRQLQLRRSTGEEYGAATLIGLAHADEAGPDDVAIDALRQVAREDGITVVLADQPASRVSLPDDAQLDWGIHVGARARFERMVDRPPAERLVAVAAAALVFAVVAIIGARSVELDGQRATALLLAALLVPLGGILVGWAREARTWKRVTRARRTERAQWLAWRRTLGAGDGSTSIDPRVLALVVATGPVVGLVREQAAPSAVGLEAVTVRTVDALRTMAGHVEHT